MKRIKRVAVLVTIAMALLLGGTVTASAASPKFSKKTVNVKTKKSTKLKLASLTKAQKKKQWNFASSDKSVATVKKASKTSCKVTGKKAGYAVIRAKLGKKTAYVLIKVGNGSASPTTKTKSWAKSGKLKIPSNKKTSIPAVFDDDIGTEVFISSISTSPSHVSIVIGETQQVVAYAWDSNYKKVTTGFSWWSEDFSIARVDQRGNIKGISEGNTTVYCSLGGKTASIDVKVGRDFNETTAAQSIAYTSYAVDGGVIVIAKNNYKYGLSLSMKCVYRSSTGAMLGMEQDSVYWLEPGRECALFANDRYNDYLKKASTYEINFTAEDSSTIISNANNISVTSNIGENGVMIEATNTGRTIEYIDLAVVYMMNGSPVGYGSKLTTDCAVSGTTAYVEIIAPYGSDYEDIPFNGYKVYVNEAYGYTWALD